MIKLTTLRHGALLSLFMLALAGCSLLAGRPHPVSHHVLGVPDGVAMAGTRAGAMVLLVGDTDTPGIYQAPNLVYSRAPGTLSHYQYARWSETPARSFNRLMLRRLDASGLFEAVADVGTGVRGDLLLNTRLLDFYHDAAQAPGVARVALEAELVDRRDAKLVARTLIRAEAPAPSHDATGAAAALGQASGHAMDQLVSWLGQVRPRDAR